MYDTPRELVEAFANENGTVFVGAGLSMGAGLPSWQQLIAPLLSEPEMRDCPPGTSPTAVAQYYENAFGRRLLLRRLREQLASGQAEPTVVHDTLLSLPGLTRIYTTNLDRLLETALDRRKMRYDRVWRDGHVTSQDAPVQLVKVHGDIDDYETIVITAADYERFAKTRPAIADQLKHDLTSTTAFFLGYSFSDPDLSAILALIRDQVGPYVRRLYTLQFAPSTIALHELKRQELNVIPLDPGPHPGGATEALADWLSAFVAEVRRAPRSSAPRGEVAVNHNLPVRSGEKLVGRRNEVAQVMDGLGSRYPLVTIEGFAGVGKTSLAVNVAYACTSLFDHVVWVSAKDRPEQKQWLNDVLNAIGTTTGLSVITQLRAEHVELKVSRVNEHLKLHQVLVVIDNFETIEDRGLVDWMVRVPGASKVLVTTRNHQFARMAYAVELRGLQPDAALELMRQHARQPGLTFLAEAPDEGLLPLHEVTAGNPYAIRLALGLVTGGNLASVQQVVNGLHGAYRQESVDAIFDELFARSWALLSDAARSILLVTPLFVGVSSIRRDALQAASGLDDEPYAFDAGLADCDRLGLLERLERNGAAAEGTKVVGGEQRYAVHSMTRAFAKRKLLEQSVFEAQARRRCSDYFLRLVSNHVVRDQPDRPYWNALVSDGMLAVDPEWPSVDQVMTWAHETGDHERLAAFVMMLVHYMDSRFLNRERLDYVAKALGALHELEQWADKALLQIDALGWTYVEENRFRDAYDEIERGLETAASLPARESDQLRALGLAWQARVRIEQGKAAEAETLIGQALDIPCPPWIKCRVYMAAGDIALKQRRSEEALRHYTAQSEEAKSYGDEGHGYQWRPRIGMAHLDLGQLDEAEATFRELLAFEQIEIGRLYAEYGIAMVAYKRGEVLSARAMIDRVREKLSHRTSSNLLLKLIDRLYEDLDAPHGSGKAAEESSAVLPTAGT
ncbi:MAG TPA: SIR2 family protein [Gemmatimonadales bacterium]